MKLKKLSSMVVVLLMMVMVLSGCGDKDQEVINPEPSQGGEASPTAPEKTGSKYFFEHKGVKINMNDPAKPVLDALGEPLNYFEAPSCAFEGMDRIYSYSGFELYTYTNDTNGGDKTEYIFTVVFMDDSVATSEGICLSDKLDKVLSAYGENYTKDKEQYSYTDGNCKLSFLFEGGEVASVEYSLVVEK